MIQEVNLMPTSDHDSLVEQITMMFTLMGDRSVDIDSHSSVAVASKLLTLLVTNSITSLKLEFDHDSALLLIMFEFNGELHHAKISPVMAQGKLRSVLAMFFSSM